MHEIPDGAIKVSIWKNQGEHGAFYSVTCRRRYKDGDDSKDTNSYGEDDLLRVSKLFDLAYLWILAQKQAAAKTSKSKEGDSTAA